MPTVVADLYLSRHYVRAELRTGAFNRLSDFLNGASGSYVSATTQLIGDLRDPSPTSSWSPDEREMVALLSEVRFINPLEEIGSAPANPSQRRDCIQVPVELEVDAWRIDGVVHLVDRVKWTDFMHSARGRFLPLSRARAQLAGSRSPVESDLLLINGSHISALYTRTDPPVSGS